MICERSVGDEPRWQFRHHPSGHLLADAENVTQPIDAREPARTLAASLTVQN